jgi:hypothetical protein
MITEAIYTKMAVKNCNYSELYLKLSSRFWFYARGGFFFAFGKILLSTLSLVSIHFCMAINLEENLSKFAIQKERIGKEKNQKIG